MGQPTRPFQMVKYPPDPRTAITHESSTRLSRSLLESGHPQFDLESGIFAKRTHPFGIDAPAVVRRFEIWPVHGLIVRTAPPGAHTRASSFVYTRTCERARALNRKVRCRRWSRPRDLVLRRHLLHDVMTGRHPPSVVAVFWESDSRFANDHAAGTLTWR